jgi:quinoprotein glucose dehydrogenase
MREVALGSALVRSILSLILVLIGALLAFGGIELVLLGGSFYYLISALVLFACAYFSWRGDSRAPFIFGVFLLVTLVWAIWESGWDGWALAPRLIAPAVLGLFFCFPKIRGEETGKRGQRFVAFSAALCLFVLGGAAFFPKSNLSTSDRVAAPLTAAMQLNGSEWPEFGRTLGGDRFSPLAQINPDNISSLTSAWTYSAGTLGGWQDSSFEATPIMVADTLYLCAPQNIVVALDPETGKERWRFDPEVNPTGASQVTACRGVAYFSDPESPDCPAKIITATFGGKLLALDALRGKPCKSFGSAGVVDLNTGLGQVNPGFYYVSSAPTIVQGKIVIGGWVADNQSTDEPSGVIRGYDATNGAFAWAWDIGRPGINTEPEEGSQYTRSTPNSWAPMSADAELGLVYVPLGNPTPDHWGGARSAETEKYGSSLVAIDVNTGAARWHFQTVHYDIWDYDLASQPTLLDFPVDGALVPAVVQPTKTGELFVFDRRTGEPLTEIEERPVAQDKTVEPDRLSPTQPFSVGMPNFAGPALTEKNMWGISPLDQLWCRIEFRKLRYDGPMTPLSTDRSIIYPSIGGGMNWGGVSVDPLRRLMIVNQMNYITIAQLVPRKETDRLLDEQATYQHSFAVPIRQAGTPYGILMSGLISPLNVPCNEPPYGTLSAVDLDTREVRWSRPFGSAQDTGPLDIASGLPIPMGMPNFGGSMTTAGGLTFIGATQDKGFRAFETSSGALLWEHRLPAGGQANPMTYISPKSGRQFVVIAAGGHKMLRSPAGDSVVAFALPKTE